MTGSIMGTFVDLWCWSWTLPTNPSNTHGINRLADDVIFNLDFQDQRMAKVKKIKKYFTSIEKMIGSIVMFIKK